MTYKVRRWSTGCFSGSFYVFFYFTISLHFNIKIVTSVFCSVILQKSYLQMHASYFPDPICICRSQEASRKLWTRKWYGSIGWISSICCNHFSAFSSPKSILPTKFRLPLNSTLQRDKNAITRAVATIDFASSKTDWPSDLQPCSMSTICSISSTVLYRRVKVKLIKIIQNNIKIERKKRIYPGSQEELPNCASMPSTRLIVAGTAVFLYQLYNELAFCCYVCVYTWICSNFTFAFPCRRRWA